MYDDLDKEDMEDFKLDNDRECLWSMVFKDNDRGVYDKKALINSKR